MKEFAIAVIFLQLFLAGLCAQDRGLSFPPAAELGTPVGKQWAVFIAIDRYREWTPLSNPVKDATEIRDILTEHYYIDEVIELYNDAATAAGIRQLFISLRAQAARNDSVFVFYAGHGQTDPFTSTGFWIPADGGADMLAQANWLPNIQVRNLLAQLPARHVFLISDSCFSGDILDASRGARPVIDSEYFRRAYSRASRQVMTSGASEAVPDVSEFALRLKSSLLRAEGRFVDPYQLFTNVREVKSSQPMLGSIRGSEHQEGGSFLFFRKEPGRTPEGRTAAVSAPAIQNPVIGPDNTRAKNRSEDAWKNKWVYVGGGMGVGSSAWTKTSRFTIPDFPYYYDHAESETAALFAPGVIVDFSPVSFFSVSLLFAPGLWLAERDVVPVIPVLGKLGGRAARIEFSVDAGYTFNAGFTLGGTLGVNIGPGILFAQFLAIPKASQFAEADSYSLVSGMMGFAGYKIGVGDK